MCFGGGNSAAAQAAAESNRMRMEEEQRKARIKEGQGNIDRAFAQFDPSYFGQYQRTFSDFYTPQIADQYERARGKLIAALAGRGTLESTTGANKMADIERTRLDALADIGNRGVDAGNELRKRIEDTRSNLYSLNIGAADPQAAAAQAIGQATAIAAPKALSPLGEVFASFMQPMAIYNKSDAMSMQPKLPWNRFSAPLSGSGSAIYGK